MYILPVGSVAGRLISLMIAGAAVGWGRSWRLQLPWPAMSRPPFSPSEWRLTTRTSTSHLHLNVKYSQKFSSMLQKNCLVLL